jgi:hypothetical protein
VYYICIYISTKAKFNLLLSELHSGSRRLPLEFPVQQGVLKIFRAAGSLKIVES